jgi:hypothetical protein
MKVFINWLIFLAIISIPIVIIQWRRPLLTDHLRLLPIMTGLQVIFFALACAFTWVEILKCGVIKPFNCLKCMCGWFALILAFAFHVEFWYMYLPAGLFVGAMFEGIKMRWL